MNNAFRKWSTDTLKYFENLWRSGYADEAGISLLPLIDVKCDENFEISNWSSATFGFSRLPEAYLEKLRRQHGKPYRYIKQYSLIFYQYII